jgi:hypothetical protein
MAAEMRYKLSLDYYNNNEFIIYPFLLTIHIDVTVCDVLPTMLVQPNLLCEHAFAVVTLHPNVVQTVEIELSWVTSVCN